MLTDEQKVKKEYPDAFAFGYEGLWQIASLSMLPIVPTKRVMDHVCLSHENLPTKAEAWADAAKRLEGK